MPLKVLFVSRLSILQAALLCGVVGVSIYFAVRLHFENKISSDPDQAAITMSRMKMLRNLSEFKYSKPLLAADLGEASANLDPLRMQLNDLIDQNCKEGKLYQASLYLRDLESGEWSSINEDKLYHPGSLIKVPMMMCYLKQSELDPGLLDRKLIIDSKLEGMPAQTFNANSIEDNKPYTIRELLKYMAVYSDNKATYLLNKNANVDAFKKVFSDLGLTVPDIHDTSYGITVKDYSLFMRVLYNATYLSPQNSDFALTLLAQSTFDQGLAKPLPHGLAIAHKFGEMKTSDKRELHESGIIYCNKRPYLVTIMTKGYNPINLAGIISQSSDLIFRFLCK